MSKVAFAVVAALAAMPAAAVTVPSTPAAFAAINDSVALNFGDGYLSGVQQPGLEGAATFRLTGLSGGNGTTNWTNWTFTIDNLANTSGGSVTASRLTSFGFNIEPNISNAFATGMFDLTSRNTGISNGINNVEVCFRDAGGNCAGGGNGGLLLGESIPNGAFPNNTFTLVFGTALSRVVLDNFVIRFQSINTRTGVIGGSGVGLVGEGPIDPFGIVPEPSSWAMLIAGFGLVGAVARRRNAAARVRVAA